MLGDAVRDVRPALTALFAGSGFILLICCVNVASLLLARAGDRRKEIASRWAPRAHPTTVAGRERRAVSAGRGRGPGGRLGGISGADAVAGLGWPVPAFSAACCLAAALLFGLVPAAESFRLDLMATMRAGGTGWLSRFHRRTGATLAAGEIMLGFVLVTGAALTARTLARVEQVRPGFEPGRLLAFQTASGIPGGGVKEWERQLAALPGVECVGATSHCRSMRTFRTGTPPIGQRAQMTTGPPHWSPICDASRPATCRLWGRA
jgi:hypothetical protein